MRRQIPLLGVHGCQNAESTLTPFSESFPFDDLFATPLGLHQQGQQFQREQVDVVHKDHTAVGPRDDTGLKRALSGPQSLFQINAPQQ